jgi:Predicted secreted protein
MKKLLLGIIIVMMVLSPIYGVSGFAVTYGEATYANQTWKDSVLTYFQSHTDKNINNATSNVITASEVNNISKNITGKNYSSNQIFSCAMVDLSYNKGIKIIVDTSKINVVTPKMYANALKSSGIEDGYVVVTSPLQSTGESALTGVLKSYEIAVGTDIPENAKKAATEELYTETQIVNQTGENPDTVASLFEKAKNETQKQNLQNSTQIENIVNTTANNTNINLTDQQTQQIAQSLANTQRAQGNLTEFKNKLQSAVNQASQPESIIDQITSFLQEIFNYIKGLFGQ